MATITLPEAPAQTGKQETKQEAKKSTTKYVYFLAAARLMATAR